MCHNCRTVIAGAIAVILTVASGPAFAAWPEKTVTVVVPYAAGGNTDIMARLATEWLSNRLGQRFIVENRVGAGATLGTAYVAKADPDGYTVLFGAAPQLLVAPLVQKVTYDARKDFAPVAVFGTGPQVLGISADVPAKNLREFVAYAKANPGKINYASGGVGTAGHLTGALLAARGGLDMVHVPYKGAQPALTDVIGGQCQLMFATSASVIPYIKAGRLRALAVTTASRSPSLPDLPTVAEAGVPGFESITWHGVVVPSATPSATVERLNRAINAALRDKELSERLAGLGAEVAPGTPQDFAAYIAREIPKWTKVVKDSGAKAE